MDIYHERLDRVSQAQQSAVILWMVSVSAISGPTKCPVRFSFSVWRSGAEDARAMWVAVLLLSGALVAESHQNDRYPSNSRVLRALGKSSQQAGCVYEGRWHAGGSAVRTREACLSCVCARGALSCRRRTCAPLPEPPPRCHVLHRKGDCCPELRCPDGVIHQQEASARLDDTEIEKPTSMGHACVEGGTVYAAGSAMASGTACEQCFCLGGARRCVRPRCLPPPPGCRARPAPGACCPQRYYCEHENISHDCVTPEGSWAMEGERVKAAESGLKCIQCFCLRGSIRCQHMSCAPSLQGCTPLVQPGQCCPHQYQCDRHSNGTKSSLHPQRQNILVTLKDEDRSLHTSKSTKRETTVIEQTTVTDKSTVSATVTKNDVTTTAKVKRETEMPNITSSSIGTDKSETSTSTIAQTTQKLNEVTQTIATDTTTLDESSEELPTEQPPGSVKVIINGTINCTTELSSTSLLLNVSDTNDTEWIDSQTQPRIPIINIESHTFPPNDIITEGSYKEGFDENETFTINVTSSLRTNTSHLTTTTIKPLPVVPKTAPPALLGQVNISKTKKEEYDYDYTEPTLPPSLPNLKIIPFVAADAVVEDDVSSKESLDYSILDREDKFPVYYPNKDSKDTIYATRKVDVYNPTQYPIFISKKVEPQYSSLTQEVDDVKVPYPSITNEMPAAPVQEYTVTASLGNSAKINYKGENPLSSTNTQFEVEPPAVNMFSPPIETEGGFVPKGPGVENDYYSLYPSTPPANIMPHLTTSMQLEPKDECVSGDGRHISEGESVSLSCSICTCAWGELHCSPRPCNTPPGCRRAASISTTDLCCGQLICDKLNNTTSMPLMTTEDVAINLNETETTSKYEKVSFTYPYSTTTPRVYTNIDKMKDMSLEKNISESNERFEDTIPITSVTSSTTEKSVSYTTSTEAPNRVVENSNHSLEYDEEDDEDDDEGFSLGSVLKLLLSETYDTTTAVPNNKITTVITRRTPTITSTSDPTTKRKQFTSSESGFVPVTHRSPYIPPKKLNPQNTINRIDHLVLGESNAIRKSTLKPTFKPVTQSTTRKVVTSTKTTPQPITSKTVEISSKEGFGGHSVEVRPPAPNYIPGLGLGLPKLAGCNIYGRMYRVGRIIAELSSPCQECKCTEFGVQCRSLTC